MLHPVNRPGCIDALWLAVFIQEELLELALTGDPTDKTMLSSKFGIEIVAWLLSYKDDLLKGLDIYYQHPNAVEKKDILAAFKHDIMYSNHFNDPGFIFHLLPKQNLPSDLAVSVAKWLVKFYDVITNIKKGFPANVSGFNFDINGQVIYSETLMRNPELRVCPVCDGTWMEKTSTGVFGSIDHFLPRSIYPALSVHPVNLLPICDTCNEKIKKDKDPLTQDHPRSLSETFHSYLRPAREMIQLNIGKPSWSIDGDGGCTQNQLFIFPDIFDLPGRWQQDEDEYDRTVRRRIRDSVDAVKDEKGSINQDSLDRILVRLDKRFYEDWGGVGNSFPVTWYFRWLYQNKKPELIIQYTS